MRAFVVLNPSSGQGNDESVREALETAFAKHRIRYEIYETSAGDNPGDVVRSRLGDGFDMEQLVLRGGTQAGHATDRTRLSAPSLEAHDRAAVGGHADMAHAGDHHGPVDLA
ncbi:MAG: hypothetical protein R6X25_04585, partial [Candidatus Krumholzibacteriia bacterium]